jgi:hypothetical protein
MNDGTKQASSVNARSPCLTGSNNSKTASLEVSNALVERPWDSPAEHTSVQLYLRRARAWTAHAGRHPGRLAGQELIVLDGEQIIK